MNHSTFTRLTWPPWCSDGFMGQEVETLEQWGGFFISVPPPQAAHPRFPTLPNSCVSLSPVPVPAFCPLGHTFVLWPCVNRCAHRQTCREEVVNSQERHQPPFLWTSLSAAGIHMLMQANSLCSDLDCLKFEHATAMKYTLHAASKQAEMQLNGRRGYITLFCKEEKRKLHF